jgi:hypothetical protein
MAPEPAMRAVPAGRSARPPAARPRLVSAAIVLLVAAAGCGRPGAPKTAVASSTTTSVESTDPTLIARHGEKLVVTGAITGTYVSDQMNCASVTDVQGNINTEPSNPLLLAVFGHRLDITNYSPSRRTFTGTPTVLTVTAEKVTVEADLIDKATSTHIRVAGDLQCGIFYEFP